jgi:hypothetical protein
MDKGFKLVRPLAGGLDRWAKEGYPVETPPLIAVREGARP